MWSKAPSRRAALLGLLALGGCGFAPVYGGANAKLLDQIAYQTPDNAGGFALRQQFRLRLGTATAPRLQLQADLSLQSRSAAVSAEGARTRINLIGTSNWVLRDRQTGARLASGQARAFTSYSATGSTIATQTSDVDATNRLATILADMIVSELLMSDVGESL